MRRLGLAVAVAIALVVFGSSTAAGHDRSVAFPAKAHPFGHSYTFWAKSWANWALGTPVDANPFVNPDNCGPGGGSHRAWFLAGSFDGTVTANCTVHSGKGLLISPAGNFCSAATNGVTSRKDLTACALVGWDTIHDVRVTVDGRRVKHINAYFLVTPRFTLDIEQNNLFGVDEQNTPAVVIGDFVMIRPLRPGWHTVVGFVESATAFPSGYAKIIYHVHVTD